MTAGELLAAADRFPFRSLRESLEDRPFVVMAPHPDDESLACGGLIAEACRDFRSGPSWSATGLARIQTARPIRLTD